MQNLFSDNDRCKKTFVSLFKNIAYSFNTSWIINVASSSNEQPGYCYISDTFCDVYTKNYGTLYTISVTQILLIILDARLSWLTYICHLINDIKEPRVTLRYTCQVYTCEDEEKFSICINTLWLRMFQILINAIEYLRIYFHMIFLRWTLYLIRFA